MNTIQDKVKELISLYQRSRRSGSTTILKEIARNNDVIVLLPTEDYAKDFGNGGMSITFAYQKLQGTSPKPIFLDNGTVMFLLERINNEFLQKERAIEDLKRTILNQNNEIQNIERHCDRLSTRILNYSKKNWFQRMLNNI